MATASYVVYFKTPIQAMTTTSPYRTSSRPATATGCSAVAAAAAGGCVVLDMTRSFRCPISLVGCDARVASSLDLLRSCDVGAGGAVTGLHLVSGGQR